MHHESAVALAESVRRGERTAVEIVQHYLARAQSSDLNAFTLIDERGALARAAAVDAARADDRDPGPLAGVPTGVKDIVDQAGLPTTAGSSFYRKVPERSATVVNRLEAAGAVMIGRTGLQEFAFGFTSENHWFGSVRNPWDPATSTGGSSGGSAAAVAAGLAAAALGTDTGGSIRGPAALCGAVALKVTHGRVPLTGVFPLAPSLDTVGPIARSTADAARVYAAIAGSDSDAWSVDRPVAVPDRPLRLQGLRIAVPTRWIAGAPSVAHVKAAFGETLDRLTELGAVVEEVRAPNLYPAEHLLPSVCGEVAWVHRAFRRDPRNVYDPAVEARMKVAEAVTLDEYVAAQRWRAELRHAAREVLSTHELIATPATAATRKLLGVDEIPTDGGEVHYQVAFSWYASLVNHAGLPALVAPLRRSGAPPPALQLIAPWWEEVRLIAMGMALEEAGLVGFSAPPGF